MQSPPSEIRFAPPSSTFTFKEPYAPATPSSSSAPSSAPSLKQRRVSLAIAPSERVVPAWSFRDDTSVEKHVAEGAALAKTESPDGDEDRVPLSLVPSDALVKKARKKWTAEETQMLVDGCNKWGVGNWKAMLKDPELKFASRSAVDLKDRYVTFRPPSL